ncbi:hypothetical protein ACGF7W_39800 [Streptomyces sp. NPDC048219]|uniref:hypothetical protein n=1 Tax=Streptomyces sp. NPDC048219 TaxID=3365517 RepID=UPI003722D16C
MSAVSLHGLRLAAVDIDGVLLNDTFSPVIHRLAVRHQVAYTADFERAVFSRPRHEAARVFLDAARCGQDPKEVIDAYFRERERYVRTHPVRVMHGALALLRRLRAAGLDIVCYGGLDYAHFERHLGRWAPYFTGPRYICTDAFRPGIEEITRDVFHLGFDQVLFIDDVAGVAERARDLGVAFIGRPSRFAHGFQRRLMREAGVRYLADRLTDIDGTMLRAVARESAAGTLWPPTTPAPSTTPSPPTVAPAAGPPTAAGILPAAALHAGTAANPLPAAAPHAGTAAGVPTAGGAAPAVPAAAALHAGTAAGASAAGGAAPAVPAAAALHAGTAAGASAAGGAAPAVPAAAALHAGTAAGVPAAGGAAPAVPAAAALHAGTAAAASAAGRGPAVCAGAARPPVPAAPPAPPVPVVRAAPVREVLS